MGLERLTAVVQGVTSNYDTDLFKDLMAKIEDLSEMRYGEKEKLDVAFRVISDHARAITFLIGDGILPSNEGRGYVLRRIIRRAIRFGQVLGLKDPFLPAICDTVIEAMGPHYRELVQSKTFIQGIIENEEKRFADTLHYSMKVLNEEIENLKHQGKDTIQGETAFKLYDTYGLSVDIVQDVARDEGLQVDLAGYEAAMARQRSLSQESWKGSGEAEIPEALRPLMARGLTSRFLGYESVVANARVTAILVKGKEASTAEPGVRAEIVLDQTPFYGEAGGQIGDTGWIQNANGKFRVERTSKPAQDLIVHQGHVTEGVLSAGDELEAVVDKDKRRATALNHTATHLLHAALRETLGDHVKQAGSRVSPERLRFDFSHFTQVSTESLTEVENLVNRYVRDNLPLQTRVMSRDEAMKTGAMAIFEERYGEEVRLVQIGDGVSMELCGGTHTHRTGDIGLFRIVSESAVGANVRRIEALTGEGALRYDQRLDTHIKSAALLLKASPDQLLDRLERLIQENKAKDKEIESLKARVLTRKSDDFLSSIREIAGVKVAALEIEASSPKELRDSADKIKDKIGSGVVLLGAKQSGKAMITCVVTKDLAKRFHAGDMVKELSGIVGGRGGGRPDMAQGGGDKPDKLGQLFEALYGLMEKTGG
jgi:alanyl-tRNA synthetase